MKKLGSSRNQCGGCREYFNSNGAFEHHRVGEFGKDRRCLTAQEMTDKGWALNKDGFWVMEPGSFDEAKKRMEHHE